MTFVDEVHDGLLGLALVPRRQRIGGLRIAVVDAIAQKIAAAMSSVSWLLFVDY